MQPPPRQDCGYYRALIQQWPDGNSSQPQESTGEISLPCSSFVWLQKYIHGTIRCKAGQAQGMERGKNPALSTLLAASPHWFSNTPWPRSQSSNESSCSSCNSESAFHKLSLFKKCFKFLLIFCCCCCCCHIACESLAPQPGIDLNPGPLHWKLSLNH